MLRGQTCHMLSGIITINIRKENILLTSMHNESVPRGHYLVC